MSMMDLLHAFSLIELNKHLADFEGPKPGELISEAERILNLEFSPTYKNFLTKYGCGNIAGQEFYGVIHNNFEASGIPDAIWLTLRERQLFQLPLNLILVYSTGDGLYYALDGSQVNSQGEYPVVVWNPGESKKRGDLEKVSDDYGEFLYNQINSALND